MEHIAKEIKAINEFCEENKDMSYDELFEEIERRVIVLNHYATEKNLPLVVSVDDIIAKHRDVDYDNYEEESSSEEEEESSSEEEEENDSYYK